MPTEETPDRIDVTGRNGEPTSSVLRPICQIQMAHDVLVQVILHETPLSPDDVNAHDLDVACSTLCWVLQHDHNPIFGEALKGIMEEMERRGFKLTEVL